MPREIKDKVILTDCDGVLLDWEFHFYRWLERTEGLHRLSDDYNIAKAVGVAQKTGSRYVNLFNRSEEMKKAITTYVMLLNMSASFMRSMDIFSMSLLLRLIANLHKSIVKRTCAMYLVMCSKGLLFSTLVKTKMKS